MPRTATGMRFASATSTMVETAAAVRDVSKQLERRLCAGKGAAAVDLVMAFCSPHHRDQFALMVETLRAVLKPGTLLACTAEGVIGGRKEVERQPGMSVLAASLPGAVLTPFTYEDLDWTQVLKDPQSVQRPLGMDPTQIKLMVLLADPGTTLLQRLLPAMEVCYPGAPVIGGMASANNRPRGNRLAVNDQILSSGAVGLAIGGALSVRTTVSQSCRPLGQPYVITRSRRHVVQELGGRKALDVVGELVQQLSDSDRELVHANGLLVGRVINEYKSRFGRGDFLVRNLAGVDHEAGYLAINDGQVHMGQTIQFQVRDQRTAEEDLALLLEAQKLDGPAAGALLFCCNSRGSRLFDQPHSDARQISDALGDAPLGGFFAAGEIGAVGGRNFVHGHSLSMVAFRSEEPYIPAADEPTVQDLLPKPDEVRDEA